MTTLFEMPLSEARQSDIQELQTKYPRAILRIETFEDFNSDKMDEAQFWAIIGLLNWKTLNSDAILAPSIEALSQFQSDDIHKFHDILNEKLFNLDAQRFAEQLGSNCYSSDGNNSFSVDSFLYARCCVVANGKEFYEKVLGNPAKMPKEFTFESLLYLPRAAWKLKTGRNDYNYFPEIWSETFSNSKGWEGITTLKDRIFNF
jgi:Protein of unknown function (DUF4240)